MGYLDDQREAFQGIEPQLDDIKQAVEGWLKATVRELRLIEPRVSARVKKPHSFVLKVLAKEFDGEPWEDPLVDCTDKVGARVDVVFLAELDELKGHISGATDLFEILKVEDKLEDELQADKLGYQGVHFDVRLRDLPDGIEPEQAVCEIQLRTNAQAAWAMAGHDLTYKAPVKPSVKQLRRMNRLTALLELFDEEVRNAVSDMQGTDGYPVAIIIRALEHAWMSHVAERYNRGLTRDIVTALAGDLMPAQAHDLEAKILDFEHRESEKLAGIYARAFVSNPLLAQPESMLIFQQLDTRPQWLQDRWINAGLDYSLLDELATIWGVRLAAPR